MRRAQFLLIPLLPVAGLVAWLRRRRGSRSQGRGGDGWRPPDAGVREPRRPRPSPSAASMAIEEDGDAVQL